jgi:transposase
MDRNEVKAAYTLKKGISLATTKRWMRHLGYRWSKTPTGQYVDGHEREDVVTYRQKTFIPAWVVLEAQMRSWTGDNLDVEDAPTSGRKVVIWHHDESIFYANDRRKIRWVHKSENAVPYVKGEGSSLMVADFISADYGWLTSPDGNESARVLFKPGKNRDGYFDCEDIINQTSTAMDILQKHFSHEDHVFVFDNATTHTKRADGALSARKMPKKTPPEGKNWGVSVTARDANGKIIYSEDGKPKKVVQRMEDAHFPNGMLQSLYFPEDHPQAGIFKGMVVILEERGLIKESKLRAECKRFKCQPGKTDCCARRTLYNQPDFVAVRSMLENACEKRGFRGLFLPKFHCEINFIEQCWGYAKRVYRQYPPSKDEEDLKNNLLAALGSIPLVNMRR